MTAKSLLDFDVFDIVFVFLSFGTQRQTSDAILRAILNFDSAIVNVSRDDFVACPFAYMPEKSTAPTYPLD